MYKMNATKIPFSNSNGYVIQNERYKSDILNTIFQKYNINIFSNYDRKYSDHILPAFKKYNIISCLITSGRPYVLYFTKILNENVCLMIDLKLNQKSSPFILSIPISCSDILFNGTIVSGELLKLNNTRNWEFLIEKCIVYKNQLTKLNDHMGNIRICLHIIKQCNPHTLTPFNIKMKTFVSLSKLEELLNNESQNIIGVKFYGLKNPITYYYNTKQNHTGNHFQKPHILTYNSDITSEKHELIKSFAKFYDVDSNNSDAIDCIFDDDVNIEELFTVYLTKTDTYGIYNIECNNVSIGLSRITTIELHHIISSMLKLHQKIAVSAYYDYNFDKWTILDIISDISPTFSHISSINDHIALLQKLPKAPYLQID